MRVAFAVEPSALGSDAVAQARKLLGPLVADSLAGNRPYFLMVTRAFLDGMPVSDWPGGNPGPTAPCPASSARAGAWTRGPTRG